MKIYEAWDELKKRLKIASENQRKIVSELGWHEQTGPNVFDDILNLIEELEYKYE